MSDATLTREKVIQSLGAMGDPEWHLTDSYRTLLLAHDAALRAALAAKEQECERLLHMTEIPVGWTTAPTEKWDALREDLAEAVRTRDRFADENDRLVAIVESAPHAGHGRGKQHRTCRVNPCDCWKSRAKEADRG